MARAALTPLFAKLTPSIITILTPPLEPTFRRFENSSEDRRSLKSIFSIFIIIFIIFKVMNNSQFETNESENESSDDDVNKLMFRSMYEVQKRFKSSYWSQIVNQLLSENEINVNDKFNETIKINEMIETMKISLQTFLLTWCLHYSFDDVIKICKLINEHKNMLHSKSIEFNDVTRFCMRIFCKLFVIIVMNRQFAS